MLTITSEGQGYWSQRFIDFALKRAFDGVQIEWITKLNRKPGKKADLVIRTKNLHAEPEQSQNRDVPYICWSGEPFRIKPKAHTAPLCSINTFYGEKFNDFYLPFAWFRVTDCLNDSKFRNKLLRENISPSGFAGKKYLVGACFSKRIPKRISFFEFLRKRFGNQVQGFGSICNTGHRCKGNFESDDLMNKYSECKFVVAMENCTLKGYITEKLFNAYINGAVPIFWGDKAAAKKYFNPKTFICVDDFATVEACADEIARIGNDEQTYNEMLSAPIFQDEESLRLFSCEHEELAEEYQRLVNFLRDNITPRTA